MKITSALFDCNNQLFTQILTTRRYEHLVSAVKIKIEKFKFVFRNKAIVGDVADGLLLKLVLIHSFQAVKCFLLTATQYAA